MMYNPVSVVQRLMESGVSPMWDSGRQRKLRKWDVRYSLHFPLPLLTLSLDSDLEPLFPLLPRYPRKAPVFIFKMAAQTGLDYMRSRTIVDCDTMDPEGMWSIDSSDLQYTDEIQSPKPLVLFRIARPTRSGFPLHGRRTWLIQRQQAIAFGELSKPERSELIAISVGHAEELHSKYSSISIEELAVEIAVCIESTKCPMPSII